MERKVDRQQMLADARVIRENISRARGYLRREDLYRCVDAAREALSLKNSGVALGLGRSEVDLLLAELFDDFGRHPRVVASLQGLGIDTAAFWRYRAGGEATLIKKLVALRAKLAGSEAQEKAREGLRRTEEKEAWLRLGRQNLQQQNFPKGKVYLRRAAETYGTEDGVLREIGTLFLAAGLLPEAAEMAGLAIERFPNDEQAWRLGIEAWDALGDSKKAEALYLDAVKIFGGHPITFLNIAKFYLKWHRKDDAYEYAVRALTLDPNLAEAQVIRDNTER